jgi:DNA-binding NtrC family response regulator
LDRILLIEDEAGSRLLFKSRLEDLGCAVVASPTGAMGLIEARAGKFDLFLVDIGLGSGIDGYEVCQRLKAIPQLHRVPVVLISGQIKNQEDLHRGYEAGCDAFLVKGDLILLEDVVRAMLHIKNLQDDLALQNRLLAEQNRKLQVEERRVVELESVLRDATSRASASRDPAAGRPDGVLIVDDEGVVWLADRGATELCGRGLEGQNLGNISPNSGLEAFVRDARTEPREGLRFDLTPRGSSAPRSITATAVPLLSRDGARVAHKLVLLSDVRQRRGGGKEEQPGNAFLARRELGDLMEAARQVFHPAEIVGVSPRTSALRERVAREAHGTNPVLLLGERGTGKSFVARVLHYFGERGGSFVSVPCGALSPALVEREIFGHVRGAFPDADSERSGLVEQTHLGTLYLEDFDCLPSAAQERLLRLLETRTTQHLGAESGESIDVRIVASSRSEDLAGLERSGAILPALAAKLAPAHLALAPLRVRVRDIEPLVRTFLRRQAQRAGEPLEIAPDALRALEAHAWPGNVDELQACIAHAAVAADESPIRFAHLPLALTEMLTEPVKDIPATRPRGRGYGRAGAGSTSPAAGALQAALPLDPWEEAGEPLSLEFYECKALERALRATDGDKLEAARLLGLGKSTFYRKLKHYGIA